MMNKGILKNAGRPGHAIWRWTAGAIAVVGVVSAMSLPYVHPTSWQERSLLREAAAVAMFAPWYAFFGWLARHSTTLRRATMSAAAGGFAIGAGRAVVVLGWAAAAAERPLLVAAVVAAWVGLIHAMAAVLTVVPMSSRWLAARLFAVAAVPALDWALCRTVPIPIPYLTSVIALSAAADARVLSALGWLGIAIVAGATGVTLAALLRNGWTGTTLAVAVWGLVVAVLAGCQPLTGSAGGTNLNLLAFRSGTDLRRWIKSRQLAPLPPDLVVLPEEEVVLSSRPGTAARTETSANIADLDDLRKRYPNTRVVSGVLIELEECDGCYRNSILIRDEAGRDHFRDKTIPFPGGERVPFQTVPFLGDAMRHIFGVSGTMVTITPDRRPILLGSLRLATAVCFEHTLLEPFTAWGVSRGEVDLLIAVASLESLGDDAYVDICFTDPIRRLHAAVLAAPIVYVTDIGVGYTTPSGRSTFTRYTSEGTVTIAVHLK